MTTTTDLDAWWDELEAYNKSNAAKAAYQNIMQEIDQKLNELLAMNQSGDFTKLPAAWKAKALWAWQQLDNARNAIKADALFMEGLNWKP